MKIIGITGGFGTGKTFVASILRSLGAKVIDADTIAHEAIRKGERAYSRVVRLFGSSVIGRDDEIDRRKLADIVFADNAKLKALNRIIHPEVIRHIKREIGRKGKEGIIVIDAPLLVEAGLAGIVDILVVVICSRDKQITRCRKKFRIKKEDVSKRIKRQISLKKKIRMADFVIKNQGARSETRRQVKEMWEGLWR